MSLSEESISQVGAYVNNQMNTDERLDFERLLDQNPELQQELQIQRELKQGLLWLKEKERFQQIHQELRAQGVLPQTPQSEAKQVAFTPRPEAGLKRWYGWAAAASLVLLVGLGWLWLRPVDTGAQLADQYIHATKSAPSPIDEGEDRLGTPLPTTQLQQDSLQLQQAVALLQSGQVETALSQLKPLTQHITNHWNASAQWYLALAYLKNQQSQQARILIDSIAETTGHPYQREAHQLAEQFAHQTAR